MQTISPALNLLIAVAKVQTTMSRRFDSLLGGLSFNDFLIMFHLNQATDGKMRRIDLAEKLGLTASGITRLLLPMEKIGLVKREANEHDARVSYVLLSASGKQKMLEALERAELFCEEKIPQEKEAQIKEASKTITELGLANF